MEPEFYDGESYERVRYVKKSLSRRAKRRIKRFLIFLLIFLLLIVIFIFGIFPVIFMNSLTLQRAVVFTNFGLEKDQRYFQSHELIIGLRNLYVSVLDGHSKKLLSLGVWHIVPQILRDSAMTMKDFDYDNSLRNSNLSVLIYFHGTGEDRSTSLQKYSVLRLLFHIITFDYRSYADSSSGELMEDLVVDDCVQLFDWVTSKTSAPVFFWGHSLGSGIAAKTASVLKKRDQQTPIGLILESAFTSMSDELYVHPYGKIFSWLPWFEATVLRPLQKNGFLFDTQTNILDVDYPMMILASSDDEIVPVRFGRKLYDIAQNRSVVNTTFYYQYPSNLRYNHNFIYEDPFLPYFFNYFVHVCTERKNIKVMLSSHES